MGNSNVFSEHILSALNKVIVSVLGEIIIGPNRIERAELTVVDLRSLTVNFPEGEMDASRLTVVLDYDPILGSYPLRLYRIGEGLLAPEKERLGEVIGKRLIGFSQVGLCYDGILIQDSLVSVEFKVDELTDSQISLMKDHLRKQNQLILDYHGLASTLASQGDETRDSGFAEKFELIRRTYDRLAPLLDVIRKNPHHTIQKINKYEAVGGLHDISLKMLNKAVGSSASWERVYQRDGIKILPGRLPVSHSVISYDNDLNRYLLWLLKMLLIESVSVRERLSYELNELEEEHETRYGAWREDIKERMRRTVLGIRFLKNVELHLSNEISKDSFLGDVQFIGEPTRTNDIIFHPVYRRVWYIGTAFKKGLQVTEHIVNVDGIPLRTRSINELYEYWSAMLMAKSFNSLGFKPVSKNQKKLSSGAFNFNLVTKTRKPV